MNKWKRGSFTVEAAFVVPVAVLLTALLIIYTFYVHNRVWYTAAAYEAVLAGNGRHEEHGADAQKVAEERARERVSQQVMPGTDPDISVMSNTWGTEVRYSGQRFPMFPEKLFSYTAGAKVEKVRPVKYIRTLWVLKEKERDSAADGPD